jgi:hypothetical protein
MKKKIVGILVGTLLIAAAVLPVAGTMDVIKNKTVSSTQLSDPEWNRTYGGSEADKFLDVDETDDGGFIACGTTETSNNHCPWILRVDSEGNEIWNWTITEFYYNDTFFDITWCWCDDIEQTDDGGYIAFFILGFDYNEVERMLGGLVKLDSQGGEEWMQIYGDEFEWTILPQSIMVVDDGFMGVGAHTPPIDDPPDPGRALCVFKTDSSGELQWHQAYRYSGYINNWARGFCSTDDDGGYLIVGDVRISENYWDAIMVKTDSNGNEEWNKTFGGSSSGYETFENVFQTNDGGYIICGQTTSFGAGLTDAWLLKTDATGNEIWNKTFGERYIDSSWDFESTADGGYIIPIRIHIMGMSTDSWVIKVNGDGIVEWKHIYEEPGRQHFAGLCSTSDDGCIASGTTGGWDTTSSDALLVKYAAYGENNAPNAPIITGETSGIAGKEYEYTFNAVDPDGGDVYYWIQWDDGCPSVEWIGPYPSGVDVKLNHTFENQGTFTIGAKARDVFDAESDWGELTVTMPRNRIATNNLLVRILEQFPLLRLLFQR